MSHPPAEYRQPLDDGIDTAACTGPPDIACIQREAGGCSRWISVDPECSESGTWNCPLGSRLYEADTDPESTCLPFYSQSGPLVRLRSAGISVETGDGRCMWILGEGHREDGMLISHPAVFLPHDLPVGSCPAEGEFVGGDVPQSIIDPTLLGNDAIVSLGDSVRFGGRSWIYYRHWVLDPHQVFGVRKLGTRLAWYDNGSESVRFLDGFLWSADPDFGDSALLVDNTPYVYGCHGPPVFLSYNCYLTRFTSGSIDNPSGYEYFSVGRQWTGDQTEEADVFYAGPHRSSVRFHPDAGLFLHVFIAGFGSLLEIRSAPAPEGPWTSPVLLTDCDLPPGDPDAFCGYPMLHPELMDPMHPDQLVITYDVDTMAPDQQERFRSDPEAYWPRLVRVPVPDSLH